jgi:pyocin large subunit-like protein
MKSGGATAAANSDINDRVWKRQGRWKSDSSKDGYVVELLIFVNQLASTFRSKNRPKYVKV